MPLYILDSDTVSFHQQGQSTVVNRLKTVPADSVYTTVITLYEQVRGRLAIISRCREGIELVRAYEQLIMTVNYFSLINIVPFTESAVLQLETLRSQKIRIGTQDLRIASIVLSMNGILITSNRRDFDKIPGLMIEDWNL